MLQKEKSSVLFSWFPVYRYEFKKLLPMFLMLFLLSFNQSTLWNMKDSIIVTASGAEVIPFLKVWAILPSAVLITMLFVYLSNRFSQEKVFYILISAFLSFYLLFAFVLYPYRDFLHPINSAAYLEAVLPAGFKGMISMYRYWTFTAFYVACELWSTMAISVLFWRFANDITQMSEVRRFYSILSFGYNVGIMVAGLIAIIISQKTFNSLIPFGNDAWEQTMTLLVLIVVANGVLTMGAFRWMHCNGVEERFDVSKAKEAQAKLSFLDSVKHVVRSKYLCCIAVLVLAYSFAINLTEVVWKDQLRHLYGTASEYNSYINGMQVWQGFLAILLSLGMAEMIKRFGWKSAAMVTPLVMTILTVLFFGSMFFDSTNLLFGLSPLMISVFFGATHNCVSKACKYSIFDATKEMAFIPMDHESKLKGKTAIDGVGYRFGKSGGSVIHQCLLFTLVTVSSSAPYVGMILLIVLALWVISVNHLGKMSLEGRFKYA